MSQVRIRLFAALADRLGGRTLELELPAGATGHDLLESIATGHPDAAALLATCRIAVDREFANPSTELPADAEIALIPPVSGG